MEEEGKQPMSHEERLELASKLDKELDDFISTLPKKKYDDGWPEDRWEEEMEKHPFFMTKPPEPGAELHPLYEGLQKLKYDPDENEPEDLAISYKEDGNFNFKYKNYRLAIMSYTEGIKIKCGNPDIEATLLNNRAASHYFLNNFRSSLKDCELALKVKPDYEKAVVRAAHCCCELKLYYKAIEYCDIILELEKDNGEIIDLKKKCIQSAKLKKRNDRKEELAEAKRNLEEKLLIKEILNRGITVEGGKQKISLNRLEPCFPQLIDSKVHLNADGDLIWPVVFLYPEYKIMDYIQKFNEIHTFYQHLHEIFETFPEWDHERKYEPDKLNIYFETTRQKLIPVNFSDTLQMILSLKEYVVKGGTPSFIILVRNTPAEHRFLENYY